jgi:hypothetical protein
MFGLNILLIGVLTLCWSLHWIFLCAVALFLTSAVWINGSCCTVNFTDVQTSCCWYASDHFAAVVKSLALFVSRVFYLPTPWSRVLEKLIVIQPHSRKPSTEPYPEPNESSLHTCRSMHKAAIKFVTWTEFRGLTGLHLTVEYSAHNTELWKRVQQGLSI